MSAFLRLIAEVFCFLLTLASGLVVGIGLAVAYAYVFFDIDGKGLSDIGTSFGFLSLALMFGAIGLVAAWVLGAKPLARAIDSALNSDHSVRG
jgi:hypothetical protein